MVVDILCISILVIVENLSTKIDLSFIDCCCCVESDMGDVLSTAV